MSQKITGAPCARGAADEPVRGLRREPSSSGEQRPINNSVPDNTVSPGRQDKLGDLAASKRPAEGQALAFQEGNVLERASPPRRRPRPAAPRFGGRGRGLAADPPGAPAPRRSPRNRLAPAATPPRFPRKRFIATAPPEPLFPTRNAELGAWNTGPRTLNAERARYYNDGSFGVWRSALRPHS